jgi:sugar phosphate isomerase/epimerase
MASGRTATRSDRPRSRCLDIRQRADDAGTADLHAVAANNDFSSSIPEHRESQLAYVRELIRMTADLGAPTLRVFAAWPGVTLSSNGGRYDIAPARVGQRAPGRYVRVDVGSLPRRLERVRGVGRRLRL